MDARDTWDRLWSNRIDGQPAGVRVNYRNRIIFSKLSEIVQLDGLSVVELGAGSGTLSYLVRTIGNAKHVTMVDRSSKAIQYSKQLFDSVAGVEWYEQDLFDHKRHYDLVVSVGLLEHFKDSEQMRVVEAHASLAPRVAIIVPACSLWNFRRMRAETTLQKYGWQFPLSLTRLDELFRGCNLSVVHNRRFMPSYGMPLTNRRMFGKPFTWLFNTFLPNSLGGLVLCYGIRPDMARS